MIGEKSMSEQPILIDRLQRVHLPLWKRLTVVTALLLSAGAIVPVTCFAHAGYHHNHHHNRYIGYATCVAGDVAMAVSPLVGVAVPMVLAAVTACMTARERWPRR